MLDSRDPPLVLPAAGVTSKLLDQRVERLGPRRYVLEQAMRGLAEQVNVAGEWTEGHALGLARPLPDDEFPVNEVPERLTL